MIHVIITPHMRVPPAKIPESPIFINKNSSFRPYYTRPSTSSLLIAPRDNTPTPSDRAGARGLAQKKDNRAQREKRSATGRQTSAEQKTTGAIRVYRVSRNSFPGFSSVLAHTSCSGKLSRRPRAIRKFRHYERAREPPPPPQSKLLCCSLGLVRPMRAG